MKRYLIPLLTLLVCVLMMTTPALAKADSAVMDACNKAIASAANGTATLNLRNTWTLDADTISAIQQAAADKNVSLTLQLDTYSDDAMVGRITVDAASMSAQFKSGLSVTCDTALRIKRRFDRTFTNAIAVMNLAQQEEPGITARIAVKSPLSGATSGNLCIYSYDLASNAYNLLQNPNIVVDANGFINFTAKPAYAFIFSINPLTTDPQASGGSDAIASAERQPYYMDFINQSLETFVIPEDRLYTSGTPKDGDLKWENENLYQYLAQYGIWARHAATEPSPIPNDGTYIIGAFRTIDKNSFYTEGTPQAGQYKLENNRLYVYVPETGWKESDNSGSIVAYT